LNLYDTIIIGAGIGGLTCAAKLANRGKKVLLLEKIHHIGGTSHTFKRKGFTFPMGPLSFSFPDVVEQILEEIGFEGELKFLRNHFQLLSPEIDVIYSIEWEKFKKTLQDLFKEEKDGIEMVFNELSNVIDSISKVQEWHPDYLLGKNKLKAEEQINNYQEQLEIIEKYDHLSSREFLDRYLSNESLKRLIGSQGSYSPVMSVVHLAFMWNVMSIKGIWFPSKGISGINEILHGIFERHGGVTMLRTPVKKILINNNQATGVETFDGKKFDADWVIANADYKKVILEMIDPKDLEKNFIKSVQKTPYTGSELCVYLGIAPEKVDLKKIRTHHLFYRSVLNEQSANNFIDFANKEIEICLWSNNSLKFVPSGKKSLVLRVNMPYSHWDPWRTGEKRRKQGYREYKLELAEKLIKTVEEILPGLSEAIEVMEIATPLTYRDWGQRTKGSIAGWGRDLTKVRLNNKLLIKTPIDHLLMVGIYSVLEPFLGGFPVSMYTGSLAAEIVLTDDLD